MPASNLIERVAELITGGEELVPESLRGDLAELQRRLREPVRVAVVGRVSAGKSTMVNALLGQRVAPTSTSECTRLVTWFHYGLPQHLVIELKAGGLLEAKLTVDGTLPETLDVPPEDVRALHCYLANDLLKWMTLIDTPGIGSVHHEFSEATEQFLAEEADSAAAAQRADAVVFLFNQVVMQDELEALQMFRAASGNDPNRSAASAVGVLSKADQLGDGTRDPWNVAIELAGVYAGKFRNEVATVVPVVGLVAEASEAATLTELDAKQLSALAAMDDDAFSKLLWSTDRFTSADAPVPSEKRERLLSMLDLYGIQNAVKILKNGTHGAFALRRELSALSGIAEVKRTLSTYFSEQDHVLKVRSVLDALNRMTFSHIEGPEGVALRHFRDQVDELRLDPVMHPIAELEAWHACCTGRAKIPQPMLDEMALLFAPGTYGSRLGMDNNDRDAMRQACQDAMVRWQTFIVTEASPADAKVARTVRRTYQLLWKGLSEDAAGAAETGSGEPVAAGGSGEPVAAGGGGEPVAEQMIDGRNA
ncbi:MAG: dynamin family protein [Acidimicrobiales bacterium]